MINIYADSPFFVDGVEFSGADGNELRKNAIFLDALSQQPIPIFANGVYKESFTGMPTEGVNTAHFWRGGFQYRSGMETAVYVVSGATVTNERLAIYHRQLDQDAPGTLVDDRVFPTTETTVSIDMSGAGYTDGEIIEAFAYVVFPGTILKTGQYFMRNAYTQSVSALQSAYGGVPTFGSLSAANLNQLANAQDWIMERFSLIPRVPFNAAMFALGTHKSTTTPSTNNPRLLFQGWINRGNSQTQLSAKIDYYVFNGEERVRIYVNSVLRYTSAALTNGQNGTLDISVDLSSLSASVNHRITIYQDVTAGQGQYELELYGSNIIPSRYTIRKLEMTATRSYYSPSDEFDVLEQMTFSTLQGRLNNFVTGTTNAKTRIDANANLFNRARMFRHKFGWDAHQINSLNWVNLPTQVRIGERYVVAGQDIKIAWGGYTLKKGFLDPPFEQRDMYEFQFTEQLTGSDKVEVKEGFFDEFEGLFVGTQYYLLGENLVFFSEYLR